MGTAGGITDEVEQVEEMEELTGSVDSIIFAATDGRFSVFRLSPERRQGTITVTVNAPAPVIGQLLSLQGEWVTHPRFGQQFRALQIKVAAPTSTAGIERFLASGAVKGIGPSMAKRIVNKFGSDTLKVIELSPKRLQEVAGIGKKTAEKIVASYREHTELRDIMLWLENHGASGTYAGKIFKQYGSFAINILEENPYRLAYDIDGIGFLTADAIALSGSGDREAPARLQAGLEYALNKIALSGQCCVPDKILIEQAAQLLGVNWEAVREALADGIAAEHFPTETVANDTLVYPRYLYEAECGTAAKLLNLQEKAEPLSVDEPNLLVKQWEARSGTVLAEGQRAAVQNVLIHGIFVLTGGPGTGKTTVVRAMLDIFEDLGLDVLLGAPTGRAAKRLTETTGRKASTVHRLLEAQGSDRGMIFGRDDDYPLETDVIVLDEVSMMDIVLMNSFLQAVPEGCHVILVGDSDQLPAVGPGSVLKDILRSGAVNSICLTEIFRQAEESAIVVNAHAINHGRMPACIAGSDFEFLRMTGVEETEDMVLTLCRRILPEAGFDVLNDVQVLSPMHLQLCGIDNLNRRLQAALNPPDHSKDELKSGSVIFREGDKVMQIKNNYGKNVFNGDIGFITAISETGMFVSFGDDQDVEYEKSELGELQLAYAMSVHKSQGSEYPVVVLPLVPGHRIMLQRNLLYTAVTRAKERVILLGSLPALQTAVENDRTKRRFTLLAERLNHLL